MVHDSDVSSFLTALAEKETQVISAMNHRMSSPQRTHEDEEEHVATRSPSAEVTLTSHADNHDDFQFSPIVIKLNEGEPPVVFRRTEQSAEQGVFFQNGKSLLQIHLCFTMLVKHHCQ